MTETAQPRLWGSHGSTSPAGMGKGSHGTPSGVHGRGMLRPLCHCVGTGQEWLPQRHSQPGSEELRVAGKG